MELKSLVFATVSSVSGSLKLAGYLDKIGDDTAIVAIDKALGIRIPGVKTRGGISYVRLPLPGVAVQRPAGWENVDVAIDAETALKQILEKKMELDTSESEGMQTGAESSTPDRLGRLEQMMEKLMVSMAPQGQASSSSSRPATAPTKPVGPVAAGLSSLFGGPPIEEGSENMDEDSGNTEEDEEDWLMPGGRVPVKKASGARTKEKKVKPKAAKLPSDVENLASLLPAGGSGVDVNQLVQLKMLEVLSGLKSKPHGGTDSGSGSEDGGQITSEEDELMKNSAKAFRNIDRMRSRIKRKPKKLVRAWLCRVRQDLGVVPGQAWTLADWVKGRAWGKHRGVMRSAVILAAVLEKLLAGENDQAQALLVQGLKATHQCALHSGAWDKSA